MTNAPVLAVDYLKRSRLRVRAVEALIDAGDFADAVPEAQESVELAVKAVLKLKGLSYPGRTMSLACCATRPSPVHCSRPTSSAGSSTPRRRSGATASFPSTVTRTSCRSSTTSAATPTRLSGASGKCWSS
jgi:HEPN domain